MTDAFGLGSLLWNIAGELRKVLDTRAVGEFTLALLVLKHASDIAQNRVVGATHRFVVPPSTSFDAILCDADKPDNARRLESALSELERANMPLLDGLLSPLKLGSEAVRDSAGLDASLSYAIKIIAAAPPLVPLGKEQDQAMSKALDNLSKEHFAKAHLRPGEFYTPRGIVRMMVELTAPRPGESVYDPACGAGGMLLAATEYVEKHSGNGKGGLRIFGQELGVIPARVARMNLLLHGVDAEGIAHGDALHNPLLQDSSTLSKFDVVMGNPPFSLPDWGWDVLKGDRFGRFKYGVPPKGRGDYAFILHMIESMRPSTGRMSVIVPHGVLFRGGSEGDIRKNLIKSNLLDAVVGLPPKLFYNTAIPTAVMFFRYGRKTDSVMFVDASRDFEVGRKLNSLRKEDAARIVKTCQERVTIAGYSRLVSHEEIAEKDFNLNIPLYVRQGESEVKAMDVTMLADREKTLGVELAEIQREIEFRLQEIGLRR
jgi:type I restriction enzyme M protein